MVSPPLQSIFLSGEIIFSCNAAAASKGLIVDPVKYFPEMARLNKGLFLLVNKDDIACESLEEKILLS